MPFRSGQKVLFLAMTVVLPESLCTCRRWRPTVVTMWAELDERTRLVSASQHMPYENRHYPRPDYIITNKILGHLFGDPAEPLALFTNSPALSSRSMPQFPLRFLVEISPAI